MPTRAERATPAPSPSGSVYGPIRLWHGNQTRGSIASGEQGGGWQGAGSREQGGRASYGARGTGSCPRTWRLVHLHKHRHRRSDQPHSCLLRVLPSLRAPHAFCLRMAFGFGRLLWHGHGWSYRLLPGLLGHAWLWHGVLWGLRPPGQRTYARRPRRVTRPSIRRPLSVEKLAQ